jgi:uncharacterized coiled-coil protein SlyX
MAFASSSGKRQQGQRTMAEVDRMRFEGEQYRMDNEKFTSLLRRATREKNEAVRMAARERSKARNLQDRLKRMEYQQARNDQAGPELRNQLLKARDAMDYFRGQIARLSDQNFQQNLDLSKATRQVKDLTRQRDHAHAIGAAREQRIIHLEMENADLREQRRQLRDQVDLNADQAAEDHEYYRAYDSDGSLPDIDWDTLPC